MGRIGRTWILMGDSWQILKQDKCLIVFPLLSGICSLLLMASYAVPLFLTGHWVPPDHSAPQNRQILYYGTFFSFYVANYFIVIFFNAAVVACAAMRFQGEEPTVGDGLRAAIGRLPAIVGWALVSATVGMILRLVEERSSKVGQIIASVLGVAWTAMCYFVVPVMVVENKGPFAALGESLGLLKKTWGEGVVGNFSFGLILFLLYIPAFALMFLGFYIGGATAILVCISIAVLYFIALALVNSALHAVFQTALYLYARDGQVPSGFRADSFQNALV